MAKAEFEEREFESALYGQLRVDPNLAWSPGQVLESHIGFDYAAVCVDSYLWALHGIVSPLPGFWLEEMYNRRIWRRRPRNQAPPDFALNLFIQAKRPDHLASVAKAVKAKGIKAPYWRIRVVTHQQKILERLAIGAGDKALVCYAAPAFHSRGELFARMRTGSIVQNTSFPEVTKLKGHSAWHYNAPGVGGVANPDPTYVEVPQLRTQLDVRRKSGRQGEQVSFDQNLKALEDAIRGLAKEAPVDDDISRSIILQQKISDIDFWVGEAPEQRYSGAVRAFLVVLAFCDTYETTWLVAV